MKNKTEGVFVTHRTEGHMIMLTSQYAIKGVRQPYFRGRKIYSDGTQAKNSSLISEKSISWGAWDPHVLDLPTINVNKIPVTYGDGRTAVITIKVSPNQKEKLQALAANVEVSLNKLCGDILIKATL